MKLFQESDIKLLQTQIEEYQHTFDRYRAWLDDKKVPENFSATENLEVLSFIVQTTETDILNDWLWHMYLYARKFGLTLHHMVDRAEEGYIKFPMDLVPLFSLCVNRLLRSTEHKRFDATEYLPSSPVHDGYPEENPFVTGGDKIIVILTMLTDHTKQVYTREELEVMSSFLLSRSEERR